MKRTLEQQDQTAIIQTQVFPGMEGFLATPEGESPNGAVPVVYGDEHGLPVLHVAEPEKRTQFSQNEELSILWHELLTPLTVIKGYTATLLNFSDSITDEERQKYILGIESASDRVIGLIDNLRDITRLEQPQHLRKQRFCISDLIQTVIEEMHFQAKDNVIKLMPHGRLPLVSGDPERLRQVFQNLIGNAIKYSRHNEDIEIEISMIRSDRELRSKCGDTPAMKLPAIIVSVSDDSVGLPENDLENIFKRFYRVKNKLTKSVTGAGLGLYICKMIMEAHGGTIWARNKYHQKGSIFRISLPL